MYFRKTYFKVDHYFFSEAETDPEMLSVYCPPNSVPPKPDPTFLWFVLLHGRSDSGDNFFGFDPDPVLDAGADLQHDLQCQHEDHLVHLHDPGSSPQHLSLSLDADRNLFWNLQHQAESSVEVEGWSAASRKTECVSNENAEPTTNHRNRLLILLRSETVQYENHMKKNISVLY